MRLTRLRFGLAPFRSPLLRPVFTSSGYVRCFSSPGALRVDYIFIHRSRSSSPRGVSPFGYPRITACARLLEAFRCYAASFFGTNALGIHLTPFVTVCSHRSCNPRRGASVIRSRLFDAHGNDQFAARFSCAPQLLKCFCQPVSGTGRLFILPGFPVVKGFFKAFFLRKNLVEMRRLELLTPSVQRTCSSN